MGHGNPTLGIKLVGKGVVYYQFGRKDPFPGMGSFLGQDIIGNYITGSKNFAFLVKNPLNFIPDVYQWDYDGVPIPEVSTWRWNDKCVKTYISSGSEKSIHDPSPLDWRVPERGSLSQFKYPEAIYSRTQKAMYYEVGNFSLIYPAVGNRQAPSATYPLGIGKPAQNGCDWTANKADVSDGVSSWGTGLSFKYANKFDCSYSQIYFIIHSTPSKGSEWITSWWVNFRLLWRFFFRNGVLILIIF